MKRCEAIIMKTNIEQQFGYVGTLMHDNQKIKCPMNYEEYMQCVDDNNWFVIYEYYKR